MKILTDKWMFLSERTPLSRRGWLVLTGMVIILSALLGILLSGYGYINIPLYQAGDIARSKIIVPSDLFIVDENATRENRNAAAAKVLPVYRFNPSVQEEAVNKIKSVFKQGRDVLALPSATGGRKIRKANHLTYERLPANMQNELSSAIGKLGINAPENNLTAYLVKEGFNIRLENRIIAMLKDAYAEPIISDDDTFFEHEKGIQIFNIVSERMETLSPNRFVTLSKARIRMAQQLNKSDGIGISVLPQMKLLLESLLIPNLQYDAPMTASIQDQTSRNVDPVMRQLKKGKVIIRQGDEVKADQLAQIEAIRKVTAGNSAIARAIGWGFLMAPLLLTFLILLRTCTPDNWNYEKLAEFSLLVLLAGILLLRVSWFLCETISQNFLAFPFSDKYYFFYILPFAWSSMLIAILAGERCALLFIIFYSLPAGQIVGSNSYGLFYILTFNLAGILMVRKVTQRIGIIASGFKIGLAAVVLFFILQIASQAPLDLTSGVFGASLAFLSGPINSLFLAFMLPICERLSKATTEIRLSELGNVNLPVIRRLILKAPGTYNHSIAVGTLCEGAAKAIGINPLFLRVASLYHDIGKTERPEYFVENQRRQINPHDLIRAEESIMILKTHVTGGVRIAEQANLPPDIVGLITQHHGTRQMRFFYEKALQESQLDGKEINESEFRYPGPKPQSKAAAILMIADSIEAASRTLEDYSQDKLLNLVQKIISDITSDEQLSECDITLSEINRITYGFLDTLTSFYHNRIAYSGCNFDEKSIAANAIESGQIMKII